MNDRVQHLSDALMLTLEDVYREIDALRAEVAELRTIAGNQTNDTTWYDRREAAEYLRCHPSTIDEMAASGRLPKHLLGTKPLYHVDDLTAIVRPALVAVEQDTAA